MQTIHSQKASNYDQVPYESISFPQSHPDRLATLAALFGLTSPEIQNARILELGCASGGNLIPLAVAFPNAHFVGVDLSSRQVWEGESLIKKLELKNIELKHLDLMEVTEELGVFDYIIAHCVFSWVPKPVQEKILEICEKNLATNGVAYIDYNTYPGWHQRGMIRDMMLYHTAQFPDAGAKAVQARALLDFLAKSTPDNNAYGILLKTELNILSQQKDAYILHDLLEDENEPLYFHQFVERASVHNLQYLGESEFNAMITTNFAPEVGETLRRLSTDIVRTEQFMDFVRNRSFRQTLLCHQARQLNRNLDWKNMTGFRFASPAETSAPREQLAGIQPVQFVLPVGVTLTISHPLVKAAFEHLAKIWPRSATLDEVVTVARENLSEDDKKDNATKQQHEQLLGGDLLTAYAAAAVFLRTSEPHLVTEISAKPKVSALVQHQARTGQRITSQLHESLEADIFVRNILVLLDGDHDVSSMVTKLEKLAKTGAINVAKDGRQITGGNELRRSLETAVENSLELIAKSGFLIG